MGLQLVVVDVWVVDLWSKVSVDVVTGEILLSGQALRAEL